MSGGMEGWRDRMDSYCERQTVMSGGVEGWRDRVKTDANVVRHGTRNVFCTETINQPDQSSEIFNNTLTRLGRFHPFIGHKGPHGD